jgi:hypothetical protein
MRNNVSQKYLLLPNSLRQTIPLSKLTPSQQCQAWEKAISKANHGKPSSKLVSQVVKEIQAQEKMDNFLIDNQEQRQLNKLSSQKQEGLNYKPGNLGCEWYVKVEQSTYEQLKDYQELNGLSSLNNAIVSLLRADS